MQDPSRSGSKLLELALVWLAKDKMLRDNDTKAKARGVRKAKEVPEDSEVFYRKYDYGHQSVLTT